MLQQLELLHQNILNILNCNMFFFLSGVMKCPDMIHDDICVCKHEMLLSRNWNVWPTIYLVVSTQLKNNNVDKLDHFTKFSSNTWKIIETTCIICQKPCQIFSLFWWIFLLAKLVFLFPGTEFFPRSPPCDLQSNGMLGAPCSAAWHLQILNDFLRDHTLLVQQNQIETQFKT